MTTKYGILVTCEIDDNGNIEVTYDDVKSIDRKTWAYQGVITSHTIKKDKLNEQPDYGLTDAVRDRALLPIRFGLGSNLLSLIRARLL